MQIGGRSLSVRWRWLVLASLIWIVAVYAIWTQLFMPDARSMLDHAQSQCGLLIRTSAYAYAYAECLQLALQTVNGDHASIAASATLFAILPVAMIWAIVLASLFLRECRDIDRGA